MLYKCFIKEKVIFKHEVIVEVDNEGELDRALDRLEIEGTHPNDIRYFLLDSGTVVRIDKDIDGDCEFECSDYIEVTQNFVLRDEV